MGAELLGQADLVVAMERRHVREAALLAPAAFGRTFTLKELARMVEAAGPRRNGDGFDTYLGRLGAGRRPTDLLGASPADDVADPIGEPAGAYRATHAELDHLLAWVVAHLWPAEVGAASSIPGRNP